MRPRAALAVAVLAAACLATKRWLARCERACLAADQDAEYLFRRGELLAALAVIDNVDARCRCARFTSGDAPPQYALAQACLRELQNDGRTAEVERVLARTRGTILRELAALGS